MSDEWERVAIRGGLLKTIKKLLKTEQAKINGLTNPTQFVDEAVRLLLAKYELRRFEHFNLHDNIIRVLDTQIGNTGDIIELYVKNNSLNCDYCKASDCVHIKFVWSDQELVNKFKRHGFKSPF